MNPCRLLLVFLMLPVLSFAQTSLTPPDTVKANDMKFDKVEVEASYPGGDKAWRDFLTRNLNANVAFDNGSPYGKFTVIVQFVVNKEGMVSDIKALTNHGYGMEEEVLRIMKRSGNWIPAVTDGRPVNAYRKQPVTFLLDEEGFEIISAEPYTLYTGINNEISVKVKRVSPNNLYIMTTKGSVNTLGDGRFTVKVNSPGRVTITVYNRKNEKEIGAYSFEVKNR